MHSNPRSNNFQVLVAILCALLHRQLRRNRVPEGPRSGYRKNCRGDGTLQPRQNLVPHRRQLVIRAYCR